MLSYRDLFLFTIRTDSKKYNIRNILLLLLRIGVECMNSILYAANILPCICFLIRLYSHTFFIFLPSIIFSTVCGNFEQSNLRNLQSVLSSHKMMQDCHIEFKFDLGKLKSNSRLPSNIEGKVITLVIYNHDHCDMKIYLFHNITYNFTNNSLVIYPFKNDNSIIEIIGKVFHVKL